MGVAVGAFVGLCGVAVAAFVGVFVGVALGVAVGAFTVGVAVGVAVATVGDGEDPVLLIHPVMLISRTAQIQTSNNSFLIDIIATSFV